MSENDFSLAEVQHRILNIDSLANTGEHTKHADAQWFGNAAMGLFIHWGIPSVSGEFDLSWPMRLWGRDGRSSCAKIHGLGGVGINLTPNEYWAYAEKFNPSHFEPEKMLAAASAAGFTYSVLTTRHHDGFALWPSEYGDFSTKNYMHGRDLVGEYISACRKTGMKVGLYYSPPDWYFTRRYCNFGFAADKFYDTDLKEVPPRYPTVQEKAEYSKFIHGQVTELLTKYGKIDLLWFDGEALAENPLSLEYIRGLQPSIVLNNRIGFGDYITPEGQFPNRRPDGWWEECHCLNVGGWGYRSHEIYKPAGFVPMELACVRSWNGNFLVNVGPDGEGRLPDACYRCFDELKKWMRSCSEAYYDVKGGPWPEQSNRPVTCRGNKWYVHFDFICDGLCEIKGLSSPPSAVYNLRTKERIDYVFSEGTLTFSLDAGRLSLMGEIAVLEFSSAV